MDLNLNWVIPHLLNPVPPRVNTYLGNILASCTNWVKEIFYLDPMDMMHKGVGTPPISCLAGPDKKIASNISSVCAAQVVGPEWSGFETLPVHPPPPPPPPPTPTPPTPTPPPTFRPMRWASPAHRIVVFVSACARRNKIVVFTFEFMLCLAF